MIVGRYLTDWLAAARSSLRPSTYRRYEQLVRVQIVPALGRISLVKPSPADIERFLASMLAAGASPQSAHHARAVLRTALARAVRHGLLTRNVAALAAAPKVERREVQVLSPDEVHRLFEVAADDRLEALYVLAVATGARQGELLALTWPDIDLDAATLRIRAAMQRVNGKLTRVEPKTARSRRTVVLARVAVQALREHRTRQLQERLWAGSRWQDHGLVFARAIGTPLDGTAVTPAFQALLATAGLPRITFHALRHTAASLLLAQGVHPRVVMEQLGHSTIALTMNTYSHVMPALERDAADRMDVALGR
ncbi:MAG: tyrosine-type recombinase/integrase [Candidatus Limnocylindria bacterium]